MVEDGPWLYVPQAVVLEVTSDIERALELTADSPVLLVIKANNLPEFGTAIALAENADAEQLHEARGTARTAMLSTYVAAERRVHGRLVAGVRTKAKRTRDGPYESVDPVEYVGAELRGVDAINKWTRDRHAVRDTYQRLRFCRKLDGSTDQARRHPDVRSISSGARTFSRRIGKMGLRGRSLAKAHRLGALKMG